MAAMSAKSFASDILLLRTRWYRLETRALLARNAHFLLMAVMILGPAIVACASAISGVLLLAVTSRPLEAVLTMVAIQALMVVWVVPQGEAVRGGCFREFLLTLPCTQLALAWIDLALVACAAHPLWLLLASAMVFAPWDRLTVVTGLALGFRLLCTAAMVIASADGWLARNPQRVLAGLAGGAVLAVSGHVGSGLADSAQAGPGLAGATPAGALMGVLSGVLALALLVAERHLPLSWWPPRPRGEIVADRIRLSVIHPLLTIQVRHLLGIRAPATLLQLAVATLATVGVTLLGVELGREAMVWWVLMSVGLATTLLGTWHVAFVEQRQGMQEVLVPLPLRAHLVAACDLALVTAATAATAVPALVIALRFGALPMMAIPGLVVAWLILIVAQRQARVRGGDRAPLLAILTLIVWAIAARHAANLGHWLYEDG